MTNRDIEKAMERHISELGISRLFITMIIIGCFSLFFGVLFTFREYRVAPQTLEDSVIIYNLLIFPLSTALIAGLIYWLYCHITKLNEWQLEAVKYFPWNEKANNRLKQYLEKKSPLSIHQLKKIYKVHQQEKKSIQ